MTSHRQHLLLRAVRAAFVLAPWRAAGAAAVLIALMFAAVVGAHGALTEPTRCNTRVAPEPPDATIEWQFAFVDADGARLDAVRQELEERGLRFRDIGQGPCWPCDERQLTMLAVARHTPASFREFEAGLCEVATRHDLKMYWGALPTDRRYWRERPKSAPQP